MSGSMITSITSLIWILLGAACWDDFDRWYLRTYKRCASPLYRDWNYFVIMLFGPVVFGFMLFKGNRKWRDDRS